MEFFVFFVEEHAAGGDESGAGDLQEEGGPVAALVAAGSGGFDFAPLDRALVGVGREGLGISRPRWR